MYSYSLQPDSLATVDSDGKVRSLTVSSLDQIIQVSVHDGPGKFTVTAGMSGSMHNNHTAQVLLLNPAELELPDGLAEWITGAAIQVLSSKFDRELFCVSLQVPVAIYGFDPDTKERVRHGTICISFIAISTVFVFVFVRHGTICISISTGQVPYTDCADVPLEVTLSNSKDFSYVSKSGAYI